MRLAASLALLGLTLVLPTFACSGAPDGSADENAASTALAIAASTIVSRADEWVTAKVPYCQAANHEADGDSSCSATCERPDNAAWDAYRSDCSGFVSWAWGLAAPGLDTSELAPADTSVSRTIPGADLQPGDALNIPGDHIVLFTGRATTGSVANFYEEPGCSVAEPYAHAFTSSVTIAGDSVYIAYEGRTFTAIRYTGVTTSGATATTPTTTPTSAGVDAGSDSAPAVTSAGSCYSTTLGRTVAMNTCVQDSANSEWYQCDDGEWVDRWDDPAACVAVFPL